ncbi:MAG: hypothetical protein HN390_17010 [Anaerolineae bacterium]|jgi:hypothetical protein|nr:hypothetical protein [Anaerolineae bacterium]MBT7189146.1 hypothetical protein [Anaerolineae bacterium]MBT7988566.1 hypothetical protein [Anaerolineae bacterium]
MFPRRKVLWKIFFLLMLMIFLLACELSGIVSDIIYHDTEEDRCFEDGGDWYYNEEMGRWMCLEGFDPLLLPYDESEAPAEVDTSVPEGTYVGTTTLPEFWDSSLTWDGTVSENEITIIADEFGNISGGMIVIGKGYESTPIDGCVSRINFYAEAEPSGQLIAYSGTIDLHITRTQEIWRSGCPSATKTSVESGTVQAQVTIIDNRVFKGVVPNYFSFEATKR